jgi:hypothetical protein
MMKILMQKVSILKYNYITEHSMMNILTFLFGNNQKQRFRRVCLLAIIIIVGTILIQCIGYDKKNGFSWRPAADININKEIN